MITTMIKTLGDVYNAIVTQPVRNRFIEVARLDSIILAASTTYQLGLLSVQGQSPLLARTAISCGLFINVRGLVGSGIFLQASLDGINYYPLSNYQVLTDNTTTPTITSGITLDGVYAPTIGQFMPYWRLRTSSTFTSATSITASVYA